MGKLRELQKNANLLAKNWGKLRSKALEETKEIALDIITDDQLGGKGIDGDGNKLPLPYAPFTIDSKQGRSGFAGITSHITLFQEGDFHGGFFGNVAGDNIITGSSDSKSSELHQTWGQSISSMTKANTERYAREAVLPELQELTRKALKL